MLKPRPTIAGRRLNVIVSRETLDRLRVVTVGDTSINTRNTPHAFTAAVPVPHRRPGQRCVMINVSLRACNAPNVAHPWTSPGLVTRRRTEPSALPQHSHQSAPYIPRCSRYSHNTCRPAPPSSTHLNRPPHQPKTTKPGQVPIRNQHNLRNAHHQGGPGTSTAQFKSPKDWCPSLASIHRSSFLSHRTPFLCHRRAFL